MHTAIFVEPENPGNIGALARAMKNFSIDRLILVNPRCGINGETKARAKHAFDIVEKARVVKRFGAVAGEFDTLVGTTGKTVAHYDEIRDAITPRELGERLGKSKGSTAIVFGREGSGLTNDELSLCDMVVKIPTNPRYPILNVTHAAVIVFYELFAAGSGAKTMAATREEKEILFKYIDGIVDDLDLIREKKRVKKTFRNVFNKSIITPAEVRALAGALHEIRKRIG